MSYLTLIITVPLTIFAVLFAVSNKAPVAVEFWPFTGVFETTINILGAVMLGGGFFLGALFVWIHSQKLRFKYWQESRKAARLEKELDLLHKKSESVSALPAIR